jgi:hypothetical protein
MIVEREKSGDERGKYLMPELFGRPKEMGIHYMNPIHPRDLESGQEPSQEREGMHK